MCVCVHLHDDVVCTHACGCGVYSCVWMWCVYTCVCAVYSCVCAVYSCVCVHLCMDVGNVQQYMDALCVCTCVWMYVCV